MTEEQLAIIFMRAFRARHGQVNEFNEHAQEDIYRLLDEVARLREELNYEGR